MTSSIYLPGQKSTFHVKQNFIELPYWPRNQNLFSRLKPTFYMVHFLLHRISEVEVEENFPHSVNANRNGQKVKKTRMFIELDDKTGPEHSPDVDGAGFIRQVNRLLESEGGPKSSSSQKGRVSGLVVKTYVGRAHGGLIIRMMRAALKKMKIDFFNHKIDRSINRMISE